MSDDRQTHWENVYLAKADRDVSWYEGSPTLSLQLMADAGVSSDAVVVDVGGGASQLVDHLIAMRQEHVTVLDLSAAALARAQARLGTNDHADWVVSDITKWTPARKYDVWHDRAAFHFLTEPSGQIRNRLTAQNLSQHFSAYRHAINEQSPDLFVFHGNILQPSATRTDRTEQRRLCPGVS